MMGFNPVYFCYKSLKDFEKTTREAGRNAPLWIVFLPNTFFFALVTGLLYSRPNYGQAFFYFDFHKLTYLTSTTTHSAVF